VFPVERLQDTFYLLDDESNFNIDSIGIAAAAGALPAITILSMTENGTAWSKAPISRSTRCRPDLPDAFERFPGTGALAPAWPDHCHL
jgi:hypothetical protein